jgi:hypothetical protein
MSEDGRPSLADVAAKIAKGEPPEWLPLALAHFSKFIGWSRPGMKSKESRKIDEEMLKAAEYLHKWLGTYEEMEEKFGAG